MRRRAAAVLVAASGGLPIVLFGWPAAAHAQAPEVSAWWNAANAGDPAPAPPVPPDVKDGDLLVQGSNTAPASPLGAAPATSQAVAGLSFELQPSDTVGALTLTIDGSPPPQVSVVVCKAAGSFTSTSNGAWSQVPPYDASKCVPGKLKDSDVVFDQVGDLVDNVRLSVVVLPGPLDRVVFKAPNDQTLDVTHGTGLGAAAPPLGAGVGAAPGGAGPAAPASSPVGGSGVVAPTTTGGALPGGATTTDPGAAPVVAGSGAAPAAGQPQGTRPVAASGGLGTGARRGIALGVIALEVLGFALIARAPAAAPAALGVLTGAGGRLRPPDRAMPRADEPGVAGGVGRFRRARRGPAPQL
jgi:hypothetical protein